jgi:hypothetical protein
MPVFKVTLGIFDVILLEVLISKMKLNKII